MSCAIFPTNSGWVEQAPNNWLVGAKETEPISQSVSHNAFKAGSLGVYKSWQSKLIIHSTDVLNEKSKALVGKNGVKRFKSFMDYPDGWDGEGSKGVSSLSVAAMQTFVTYYGSSIECEPSLFLSDEGGLMLGWEDENNCAIEIEFGADLIGYYIESLNMEGEALTNQNTIEWLGKKLFD